jgi:alkaline phosphatase
MRYNNHMTKNKTQYVDGFVLVVPKNKVAAYKKMAAGGAKIWMKHGALDYKECMGDDLTPDMKGMPVLRFGEMAKATKNETVWFSYITYKSRAHRDQVNKRVMKEMEKAMDGKKDMSMPFDMKRMAFGGFRVVVSG